MNRVILKGTIWGIQDSHQIGDVQYQKANLTVKNTKGTNNVITLQFKKFQCSVNDGEYVELLGNLRSYSKKIDQDKNKVSIYVYTYFDSSSDFDEINSVSIDGKICSMDQMRYVDNGKNIIHFILANNIISGGTKLNSYIPCIAWGNVAKRIEKLQKNDTIIVNGELHSREYKKPMGDNQFEIRVAHELLVTDFQVG